MIAPEIVIIQRLKFFSDRNDTRSGRVERNSGDRPPVDSGAIDGLSHGIYQRIHVIGVALRRVIRIVFAAMQRILGCAGAESSLSESKIETRTFKVPKSTPATMLIVCQYISQPRYFVAASCTTAAVVERFAAT